MKYVKHVRTQLFSLPQLKHNENMKQDIDFMVFIITALGVYNSKPRKFERRDDYFTFLSEQSGLSFGYIKNRVYKMIREGEAKWSEKKGRRNYLYFNKQMLLPYKVIRYKAIKYKYDRYKKLNLKFGPNYKADSDMDNYVMLSQKFYDLMRKYELTVRQTIILFLLFNKKDLTENSKLSMDGLADTLCITEKTLLRELRVLIDKGMLLFKSGQEKYEMNFIKIVDEVKDEIEDAIKNGSTSPRKVAISANIASWFYKWYNIPSNRYIIGGYFDFKSKRYIKRKLSDAEYSYKKQIEERKKLIEEKEILGTKYKRSVSNKEKPQWIEKGWAHDYNFYSPKENIQPKERDNKPEERIQITHWKNGRPVFEFA